MEALPRFTQGAPLLVVMALCVRVTTAHLIAALPIPPHPAAVPFHTIPVFAPHTKLIPHPGAILAPAPHGTAALIGPFSAGTIVAAPINAQHPPQLIAHQLVQYNTAAGVPVAVPLKLLFTRFPPFIEAIVQRIQNYYSTYNNIGNEEYPASPPQNDPPSTTTTTIAPTTQTTTQQTTTTTTTAAPPVDEGSTNGNKGYGNPNYFAVPPSQIFGEPEGGYRYDPPRSNPFRYPKSGFQRFTQDDVYYPRS